MKVSKQKARAAGHIFNGLCTFLGDEGTRLKRAVAGAVDALGEEGCAALATGDLVGAALEGVRNVRGKKKPASEAVVDVGAGDEQETDDDDVDPF